jgi:predicted O-linked N-acetylglucosamine transferase (SPINDLY family)
MDENSPDREVELATQEYLRGQLRQAESRCRRTIARDPNHARALHLLGLIAYAVGKHAIAVDLISQAVRISPRTASFHNNLGLALLEMRQWDRAIAEFAEAIQIDPSLADALFNLGNAYAHLNQLDLAVQSYRRVLAIQSEYGQALTNLGGALVRQAAVGEALDCFRKAIAINPGDIITHSNLIYMMHFHPDCDAMAIRGELQRWNQQFALPLRDKIRAHTNTRDPQRRLRIGYVSGDWREHCQSLFTLPLLKHHDPERFHITCYSNVAVPDALTAKIRSLAGEWRDITRLTDEQAAEQVRSDGIDILVDLTVHMSNNRLLIFAHKPAPIQITWLGYPGSTGMETVDYRLTDRYLDPPDPQRDAWYTEQSIRLPDSFWCYSPVPDVPPVAALPAQINKYITFGCLNNFNKISEPVLSLWADAMRAAPESRLLLITAPGSHRERTLQILQRFGVEPARVQFVPYCLPREYMELYHRVDISLDTFPANGHTTSMDSLYMGVPVVTLPGATAISRGGLSILSTIGLPELAGLDRADFVRIAIELASDVPRLARLRSTLRQRMESSPLMDAPRFAAGMEAIFRDVWRQWCGTQVVGTKPS